MQSHTSFKVAKHHLLFSWHVFLGVSFTGPYFGELADDFKKQQRWSWAISILSSRVVPTLAAPALACSSCSTDRDLWVPAEPRVAVPVPDCNSRQTVAFRDVADTHCRRGCWQSGWQPSTHIACSSLLLARFFLLLGKMKKLAQACPHGREWRGEGRCGVWCVSHQLYPKGPQHLVLFLFIILLILIYI